MKSFLQSRLKSFGFAFEGLINLIRTEKNMWIHLSATIIVVIAGLVQNLDFHDWCFIFLAIGLVWITEACNTAIERICNIVQKEYHPVIKQVKDISAAAVLIASGVAVIIGGFIFFG